jgi:hypothetical protein
MILAALRRRPDRGLGRFAGQAGTVLRWHRDLVRRRWASCRRPA